LFHCNLCFLPAGVRDLARLTCLDLQENSRTLRLAVKDFAWLRECWGVVGCTGTAAWACHLLYCKW
jgi:hypothetical protein